MKRLALLLLLCAPSTGWGLEMRPALWGAYSGLSMGQVNDVLKKTKSDIESSGAAVSKQTFLGPAWVVGFDYDFLLLGWLSVGPRVEYLQGVDAVMEAALGPATMKATYSGHLLPLMLGAKLLTPDFGSASFWGAAYAGKAWATVGNRAEVSGPGSSSVGDVKYSGSTLCGELEGGMRYRLGAHWSVQAQGGWRFAQVAEVGADADEPNIYHVKKGDKALDAAGNALPVDFSGWNLGLGVALQF